MYVYVEVSVCAARKLEKDPWDWEGKKNNSILRKGMWKGVEHVWYEGEVGILEGFKWE